MKLGPGLPPPFPNNGWVPNFDDVSPFGFSNGGYINTHCFSGGWNPRVGYPNMDGFHRYIGRV